MALSTLEITSLEGFNEWIDKCRVFAADNWDLIEKCEVVLRHDPVFDGNEGGWDKWKEGGRAISVYIKVKAPE